MNIPERIDALRALMKERGYYAYVVPTDDFHQSEYVGEHFKARAYMTGFNGSAGTAVITQDAAGLWTDGRYFLQAENQLAGSGVTLFKIGEPDVPTIENYLKDVMPQDSRLGFDGRVIAAKTGLKFRDAVASKNVSICCQEDLVDLIWTERPALSEKPAFALSEKYTGESTTSKLDRIRTAMKEAGANVHVVASLDDICWITNLRGQDIEYFPLLLSYAIITMDDMKLFIDEHKLTDEMKSTLAAADITLRPYNAIYEDIRLLTEKDVILVDPNRLNYALYNNIPEGTKIVEKQNPSVLMKSLKNDTELHNIVNAHIKDGIAVTRFMYWLKKNVGTMEITELDAAEKLEEFRKEQDGYLWQSFGPICASGEHAARPHYSATKESNVPITTNGLFLTDTGGGYLEGSTDITRTFAFGDVPHNMKEDFTSVLLGNLHLANVVFPHGTTGGSLDVLARIPLWNRGLDFNHGTGHGVGYLMNIHEEPARIRHVTAGQTDVTMEAGMIITNEPGLYIAGSHGVRIENELMVCKGEKNDYAQFMYFEPITYVPIDLDAVLPEMMSKDDKKMLNDYHKKVYEVIAPHLCEEERQWLEEYTREI